VEGGAEVKKQPSDATPIIHKRWIFRITARQMIKQLTATAQPYFDKAHIDYCIRKTQKAIDKEFLKDMRKP
jgi:hypothetical protein